MHYAMVGAAEADVATTVVAALVVAAVVVLLVVEESHGMILCLEKVRFYHLSKRCDGRTDLEMVGRTDGPTHRRIARVAKVLKFFNEFLTVIRLIHELTPVKILVKS